MDRIEIDYTPLELLKLLEVKKLSISIAESCTGGLLGHLITNIEGISKFFKGGVICYSNESKINILNVDKILIEKYSSVSREVTEFLAINVKKLFSTDIGVGITCYASTTDDTITLKGLSFVSISLPDKNLTYRKKYRGTRIKIKTSVARFVIEQLIGLLK